jgi:hypothetical protein
MPKDRHGLTFLFLLLVLTAIVVVAVHYKNKETSKTNRTATELRGESICERSNSDVLKVEVGFVYRPVQQSSNDLSTVRCTDKATGEVVAKEFKNVLYREKETTQ